MTQYILLLQRSTHGFNFKIITTCAVVGKPTGYYGVSRTFENERELSAALYEARVADYGMNEALTAVRSGVNSFAPITYDQASSLKLLASADEK